MKHKNEEPEKEQNGERWLLTYSDMITLLLALFIILYSMSSINEKKLEELAKNFHSALGNAPATSQGVGGGGSGSGSGVAAAVSSAVSSSSKPSASSGTGNGNSKTATQALNDVYKMLQDYITKNHLQGQIGLENTNNYIQIHLKDLVMFEPNSPDMLSSSQPIMKEIEEAISSVYGYVDHITISGHTADVVVHSTQSDQISWQLSTDRAVTVLNSLIGYGLQQDKLSIQGYSHFEPVAPNDTAENQAKNRRVEITIYKSPTIGDSVPGASSEPASSNSASSQPSSSQGGSDSSPTSSK